MPYFFYSFPYRLSALMSIAALVFVIAANAQSSGNSGSVSGIVQDVSGAVVPNAKVEIRNPVSGFDRSAVSDSSGRFELTNIPFNPYHLVVTAEGFGTYSQDVEPRSAVPVTISVKLQVAGSTTSVTVEAEGGDLIENDSTFHTDVDKNLFDKLPLESQSSSVSSSSHFRLRGSPPTPTGCFTAWGTTLRIPSRSMVSRSPINKAKCFPTRFRWMLFSRWKSFRALHRPSMGTRPAS